MKIYKSYKTFINPERMMSFREYVECFLNDFRIALYIYTCYARGGGGGTWDPQPIQIDMKIIKFSKSELQT